MVSMQAKLRRKQGRRAKLPPFVPLFKYMLDCPAWLSLSPAARAAYVQLARRYDGCNNGMLALSVRTLAEELGCSKNTAGRLLTELEDAGFIETVMLGRFARQNRKASEYRLTIERCDVTGALPSKKFMATATTKQRPLSHHKYNTVRPGGQSGPKSSPRYDERDRQAHFDPAHGKTTGTHIHIHHGGGGSDGAPEPPSPSLADLSSLPSFVGSNSREKSPATSLDPPWTVGGQDAWQQCYELAWANCGQPGVDLVELVRENDSATAEDVLEAIEASNKSGKPLDNELASFLD
jgi:Helix-turn-helix domain